MTKEEYVSYARKEFEIKQKNFEHWLESLNNSPKEFIYYKKEFNPRYTQDFYKLNCPKCKCSLLYAGQLYQTFVCSKCFSDYAVDNEYFVDELKEK